MLAGTQAASAAGATCQGILTGLGRSPGGATGGAYAYGCSISAGNAVRYHTTAASVTCAASNGTYTRACACDPVVGTPPPTYVSASSGVDSGNTFCTVTKPTGLAVGDLMIGFVDRSTAAAITPPSGWTNPAIYGSTIGYPAAVYYRIADAGDVGATDYTWSWTGIAQVGCLIAVYRNVDQANPIDFMTSREGNSATATYNAGDNQYDNALSVAYATGVAIPATPTGYTSRFTDGGWMMRLADLGYPYAGNIPDASGSSGGATWQAKIVVVNGVNNSSPPACSGYSYGGRCYYLGVLGDSCDTTCTNAGKTCDLAAIKKMNSLAASCSAVLTGLGKSPGTPTAGTYTYGCGITGANAVRYDDKGFTATCAGTNASYQRACGCK